MWWELESLVAKLVGHVSSWVIQSGTNPGVEHFKIKEERNNQTTEKTYNDDKRNSGQLMEYLDLIKYYY